MVTCNNKSPPLILLHINALEFPSVYPLVHSDHINIVSPQGKICLAQICYEYVMDPDPQKRQINHSGFSL